MNSHRFDISNFMDPMISSLVAIYYIQYCQLASFGNWTGNYDLTSLSLCSNIIMMIRFRNNDFSDSIREISLYSANKTLRIKILKPGYNLPCRVVVPCSLPLFACQGRSLRRR